MPKKPPYRKPPPRVVYSSDAHETTFFKEWRIFHGLTQQKLAERLGTTKTRVSMKENGNEEWDGAYLAAMAYALQTDRASLLIRNPLDKSAPWSLLESLKPENQAKVKGYISDLGRAEETERAPAPQPQRQPRRRAS